MHSYFLTSYVYRYLKVLIAGVEAVEVVAVPGVDVDAVSDAGRPDLKVI